MSGEQAMNDWKLPWEGGCRCGEVRFRVTGAPLLGVACHCAGCQRMTGSAFALSLGLRPADFEITQGEPVLGGVGQPPMHYHCPSCKSWMFTKPPALPTFMNLRPSMLDDHAWFAPLAEVWTSEGFAWAKTGAPHSYPTMPSAEGFGELMAEYAEKAVRPA
jgi:hypothetical protein